MKRRFLVRHGETDWNVAGRLQGRQDVPLNRLGRMQAAQVGRVLNQLVADPSALTYVSSSLSRAVETMRILRTTLDLPAMDFTCDQDLEEISFGRWEGLRWNDLRRRFAQDVDARERDPWSFTPPGGENYARLAERAEVAIDRTPEDTVIVTHGGVIRAMLHVKAGMPMADAAQLPVRQGAIYVLAGGAFKVAD